MQPLHVRYRHDIYCPHGDCAERVGTEGDVSEALNADGSTVTLPGFDERRTHTFEIACTSKHRILVHFPKDIIIVKTPGLEGGNVCPPAVLLP